MSAKRPYLYPDEDYYNWSQSELAALAALVFSLDNKHQSPLFEHGSFTLHSGSATDWRLNCEVLDNASLYAIAAYAAQAVGPFGSVEGVPKGGLKLAEALAPFVTEGRPLIVDDVLTTGASMEQQRAGRDAVGFVIFARGRCPDWVTPMWGLNRVQVEDVLVEALYALVNALQREQLLSAGLSMSPWMLTHPKTITREREIGVRKREALEKAAKALALYETSKGVKNDATG